MRMVDDQEALAWHSTDRRLTLRRCQLTSKRGDSQGRFGFSFSLGRTSMIVLAVVVIDRNGLMADPEMS